MGILEGDNSISTTDINNTNHIFRTITYLLKKSEKSSVVNIKFDSTIRDINPIFFIILLSECKKIKKKLFIDTRLLSDFVQRTVQHFLRQQLDLKEIELLIKDKSHKFDLNILFKSSIAATVDATRSAIAFSPDKENGYHILPIMALRHYQYLVDRWDDRLLYGRDNIDPIEKRKAYYSRVALHHENLKDLQAYQRVLEQTIEDFFRYLHINNKLENAKPLSTILFELIDNIRKHTPDEVSGHFSFSRIQKKDYVGSKYYEYQMIVADNGEEGILQNYLNELENEREKLSSLVEDEMLLKDYDNTIELLHTNDNKNNKQVLKELYDLESIQTTHQVPRLAMHFGIPMLLKMLLYFKDKNSKQNLLEIYTHRDEKFYKITYDNNAEFKGVSEVDHNIKGTYIILTFTDRIQTYKDETSERNFVGNVKNQDYEEILQNYKDFKNKIDDFRLIKKINNIPNNAKVILDASITKDETFSEFLRQVYFEASRKSLTDVVIVNTDIKNIYSHLQLMAHIIYDNLDKPYDQSINLLFFDKYSPGVIFLGGRSKEEFLFVADKLKHHYQIDTSLGLKNEVNTDIHDEDIEIESSLFYQKYLLPFELFEIKDENLNKIVLLQSMLENFLNEHAKKNIHVDTHVGYHIDHFLNFKQVFEDFRWVKRFAFILATKIQLENELTLFGLDKYTNMLVALTAQFLQSKNNINIRFYLGNILQDKETIKKRLKQNYGKKVLIASVVVDGDRIDTLSSECISYGIIHLLFDNSSELLKTKNVKKLFDIKNKGKVYEVYKQNNHSYCQKCIKPNERMQPLLNILGSDPFRLENVYFDRYKKKNIQSYTDREKTFAHWKDSIYFGHVERGSNHYLHYVDTATFFEENKEKIHDYLESQEFDLIKESGKKYENVVILSPKHDTNNNFVALVNKVLFDNEAIVLSFDKTMGEDNFHFLKNYNFTRINTFVVFVDDSLSSGYTAEYFFQISKSLFKTKDDIRLIKNETIGFDKIIILVDRISSYDEMLLAHYLKSKNLQDVKAYTTLEIRPIKKELEDCFLCAREQQYLKLAELSALDLTTFQMARRAWKLKKVTHKEAHDNKETKLYDMIKSYIKTIASDYIYLCYGDRSRSHYFLISFPEFVEEFTDKIKNQVIKEYHNEISKYKMGFIESIIRYESEIALLKALSFPKASYFYEIKNWVWGILTKYVQEQISNSIYSFSLEYLFEKFQTLSTDNFVDHYTNKTNIDRINAYISILGYMGDVKLLDTDMIRLYVKITQVKLSSSDKKSTFHTYPFAVKMTISENKEKARFFEENLQKVSKDFQNLEQKQYTHFNALRVENGLYWENYLTHQIQKKDKNFNNFKTYFKNSIATQPTLTDKIYQLKKLFKLCGLGEDIHFFISPLFMIDYSDYKNYLDDSESQLIDLFNDFVLLEQLSDKELIEDVRMIYRGAIDIETNKENPISLRVIKNNELSNKIDDTWANMYKKNYTIVRLTRIEKRTLMEQKKGNNGRDIKYNHPVWFRPFGCVVVKMSSMNHKLHMDITRTVMVIKKYFLDVLSQAFSEGVIQEAIEKKYIKQRVENEIRKKTSDIIANIHHSVKDFLDIKSIILDDNITKEQIASYIKGLKYMSSISMIEDETTDVELNLLDILYDEHAKTYTEFLNDDIKQFIQVAHKFSNQFWYNVDDETLKVEFDESSAFKLKFTKDQMRYFIFEFIFNALKAKLDKNNGKPHITVRLNGENLYISNSISENEIETTIEIINEKSEESSRQGIKRIKRVLQKHNYILKAEDNNGILEISIEKEKAQ